MSIAVSTLRPAGLQLIDDIRDGSRPVWWSVIAFCAFTIICVVLQQFDTRMINGVNVWLKPAKFFASLAIQFATVSWALSMLPKAERNARSMRGLMLLMIFWGWLEMAYVVFRASRGEPSHFNDADAFARIAYSVMGLGAVSMTVIAGYVGIRLWRHRRDGLWTEAAAVGLFFGAILGTVAGAYLSAQTGHTVGGSATDTAGTGLFAWSTSGGDLRIAHFVGLHAAQIIPFAALSGRRDVVWGSAVLCAALTLGTFAMAVAGIPLFKV
jgi:hypothetical protein